MTKRKYSKKQWKNANSQNAEPNIKMKFHGQLSVSQLAENILEELAKLDDGNGQIYKNCNLYMTPTLKTPEHQPRCRVIEVKERSPLLC